MAFTTITLASGTAQGRQESSDDVCALGCSQTQALRPRPSRCTSLSPPTPTPPRAGRPAQLHRHSGPTSVRRRTRQALPRSPWAGGTWATHKVPGPQRAPGRSSDDSWGHVGCSPAPSRAQGEQERERGRGWKGGWRPGCRGGGRPKEPQTQEGSREPASTEEGSELKGWEGARPRK